MPATAEFAWQLALILAILTMTIGNVCALWQRNIRRLMAYSSIAHGGYPLIGLAAAAAASASADETLRGGTTAMLFYVLVYALATMGTFAALAYLGSSRRDVDGVEELAGLAKSQPLIAAAIAVCMFSLAGIPPLAGFWGKLTLFGSAVQIATAGEGGVSLWFTFLVVIGALNAAIAAAYYLRIVAVMYFHPATATPAAAGGPTAQFAALLCALLVIAAGILPSRLLDAAARVEGTHYAATSAASALTQK
jgi:NADH-quinone oxidoreductase subunit N